LKKFWKIWIDTGGTFTDCLAYDPHGKLSRIKILSSGRLKGIIKSNRGKELTVSVNWPVYEDIFRGYQLRMVHSDHTFEIVDTKLDSDTITIDTDPGTINDIGFEIFSGEETPVIAARLATKISLDQHLPELEMRLGSTKGTNALLEGKGSKVVFITTKGHGEMLDIGTQQRPDLFALNVVKNPPIYNQVIEVDERILSHGQVTKKLEETTLFEIVKGLSSDQDYAFAICLMNSYKNPKHEVLIDEVLRQAGITHISTSSQLVNEIGFLTRAQTTVVNAYLSRVIGDYLSGVQSRIPKGSLRVMTSAGGLVNADLFWPKDSLMSGPAGGVVGCASVAKLHGFSKILSFDMGGTSTDVSRFDDGYDYKYVLEINNISINSPTLAIETVAAGGGSICDFDGYKLTVGPESASAYPGPACYGNNGPLAITDINLLLGRIDETNFSIPLDKEAAQKAFYDLKSRMQEDANDEMVLQGFLKIANEKMAEAIRKISLGKGYDPSEYVLLAFGGAGGQHACSVAELLNIDNILIPFDAGLLSAFGMGQAEIERFVIRQILKPISDVEDQIDEIFHEMHLSALKKLEEESISNENTYIRNRFIYLRFLGQETTLEVEHGDRPVLETFEESYRNKYGHWLDDGIIEVESLKLIAASRENSVMPSDDQIDSYSPQPVSKINAFTGVKWEDVPAFDWDILQSGAEIDGPAILMSSNSTLFLEPGWELKIVEQRNAILYRKTLIKKNKQIFTHSAELELYTNRFTSVADDMGSILQRTSFSVNVKDRLDFSCAVLNSKGFLVANAPHIPVHLGSLGVCVRSVAKIIDMHEGDVIITNHPAFGGSHLPDVTLIAPVIYDGELIGYVANRAHHAEIGGKTPGSMPADASCLGEEGVVIAPRFLVKNHQPLWSELEGLLKSEPYPSRSVKENLADLNGALASIQTGIRGLQLLCKNQGVSNVKKYMEKLLDYSGASILDTFKKHTNTEWLAEEALDDGNRIKVSIRKSDNEITFDFTGSAPVHPGNLNATFAILNSAVVYVLRLMIDEPLPLNEGLMKYVKIQVPEGMLNPTFGADPMQSPAVVGGNTETSQRIVDTIIKALRLAACSQGTMNNLIFGNEGFGFYETIGGGVGAGNGFNGANAVHQHMTNTKITDPEILEFRYPVVLEKMGIRKNSGGDGQWKGGNGIVRQLRFEEDVILTILSQHRVEKPFGMEGGQAGETGKQTVIRKSGEEIQLKGIDSIELRKGDRIRIETPGGGGFGAL
jgi:5-oxoprolinase (ATP-hydrolysing)